MIISLDYDDTFTKDPQAWTDAMRILKRAGHTVIGVTMRYPGEASGMDVRYDDICETIYFTGRAAKDAFLCVKGVHVDVWIDDNPKWILTNAAR